MQLFIYNVSFVTFRDAETINLDEFDLSACALSFHLKWLSPTRSKRTMQLWRLGDGKHVVQFMRRDAWRAQIPAYKGIKRDTRRLRRPVLTLWDSDQVRKTFGKEQDKVTTGCFIYVKNAIVFYN